MPNGTNSSAEYEKRERKAKDLVFKLKKKREDEEEVLKDSEKRQCDDVKSEADRAIQNRAVDQQIIEKLKKALRIFWGISFLLRKLKREIVKDSKYLYDTFSKPLIKLCVLAILGFYITRLFGFWRGPESYKIYFIGDLSSCVSTKQIYDGIEELRKYPFLKINGVPIEIIDINDRKNPVAAQIISKKLSKANDTLMIIGHINSTQTEAALPNYLSANPPIPVILTRETNPYLVPASISKHYILFSVYLQQI